MAERVKKDMGAALAALDFDAELMLRVKEGDGASFGVLLEKHRSSVVHFLYRMTQHRAVAEELAQEVFQPPRDAASSGRGSELRDRKSTRLNSSHLGIS